MHDALSMSSRSSELISSLRNERLGQLGRMMQNVPDKILHEPRACSQNLIEVRIRVTNARAARRMDGLLDWPIHSYLHFRLGSSSHLQ